MSTGRAPKERCERWMSEAMSRKSHSAEVVKANVHKEGTKQRQFLPSLSDVELVAPLLILQRNKKYSEIGVQPWRAAAMAGVPLEDFGSDCGKTSSRKTTCITPLTVLRPPVSASVYAKVPFCFAKKTLFKSPVLKSRGW